MADRTSRIESAVEGLQRVVASLQQRLDAIEAKGLAGAPAAAADAVAQSPAQTGTAVLPARARVRDPCDPITGLSLIGRPLVVLAGGFFLRAMTDAGTLPVPVGIGLVVAYAAVWLVMRRRLRGVAWITVVGALPSPPATRRGAPCPARAGLSASGCRAGPRR